MLIIFYSTKHHSNTGFSALTQGICTKAEQPSEVAWHSVQPSFSAPWQWLCNFSCLPGDELNWLPFQELQLPAEATHNNKIGYELRMDMVCSWLQLHCKLRHQQHQHQLLYDSTIHPMFMASADCQFHIQGMNIIGLHDVINLRWPYPSGEDWSCTLCIYSLWPALSHRKWCGMLQCEKQMGLENILWQRKHFRLYVCTLGSTRASSG